MKTLTKAEELVMQVLWKIGKGFLKDIVEEMPNPKPHPNTVATLLKILIDKKFVTTETFGRMNEYSAIVKKQAFVIQIKLINLKSFTPKKQLCII